MATIYFNWYEIHQAARKDPAAIIILTHALGFGYNSPIAWGKGKSLLQKLNIHHIPAFLFQTGLLEASKGNIFCTYKTKQPQSYIKNSKFLTYNAAAHYKDNNIKALSMRKISYMSLWLHRINPKRRTNVQQGG